MAIAFKLIMGVSAIASVLVIAASERGPLPVQPVETTAEAFEERFPYMIVTPKQNSERTAALPSQDQIAHASAGVDSRKSGHNRKLRETCQRSYYYIKRHRYWRCKRD